MALTAKRAVRIRKFSTLAVPHTAEQVYQGGVCCWETATGLGKKGAASLTLSPIGVYAEDALVASGGTALIHLFREITALWIPNASGGDAVTAALFGSVCWLTDDNTVQDTDASGTLSVAGRVWGVDTLRGVLVEPLTSEAASLLAGLEARVFALENP